MPQNLQRAAQRALYATRRMDILNTLTSNDIHHKPQPDHDQNQVHDLQAKNLHTYQVGDMARLTEYYNHNRPITSITPYPEGARARRVRRNQKIGVVMVST